MQFVVIFIDYVQTFLKKHSFVLDMYLGCHLVTNVFVALDELSSDFIKEDYATDTSFFLL